MLPLQLHLLFTDQSARIFGSRYDFTEWDAGSESSVTRPSISSDFRAECDECDIKLSPKLTQLLADSPAPTQLSVWLQNKCTGCGGITTLLKKAYFKQSFSIRLQPYTLSWKHGKEWLETDQVIMQELQLQVFVSSCLSQLICPGNSGQEFHSTSSALKTCSSFCPTKERRARKLGKIRWYLWSDPLFYPC